MQQKIWKYFKFEKNDKTNESKHYPHISTLAYKNQAQTSAPKQILFGMLPNNCDIMFQN